MSAGFCTFIFLQSAMPKNKNAYVRYLIIHSQVKRNKYKYGYPTMRNLLYCLEDEGYKVSGSTVEKDIKFLKYERRAPIYYDQEQRCYRYKHDWDFDLSLSTEDIRILRMLVHKLEIFGEAKEFLMVKESIDRITSHFDLAYKYGRDRIDKYILFEYSKGFTGKHLLSPVYEAIHDRREISFTHCRYDSGKPTHRTIQPYSLKEHRNRWYVIGRENGNPRIFGVDRISDLELTERFFVSEPEFYDEIFRVLYDAVGVMAFGYESEDVILQFAPEEANYIKSLMLHRSQEIIEDNDKGLKIKMHVKITAEFIKECILRYGHSVRVLKPDSLVEDVKKIYLAALDKSSV